MAVVRPLRFHLKKLLCCELSACYLHTNSSVKAPRAEQPLSPAVRYLVDSHKIDVRQLQPTGPKNRLLKWDVMHFLSNKKIASKTTLKEKTVTPDRSKSFTDIPLTNMRKTIAKRLTLSKSTIPYSYAVVDCRMDNILRLREELLREKDLKVSVNDLVVKATALSLQKIPECNASWVNDRVEVHPTVDVSVAVATEGGLITPILKNADVLKISELSSQIRVLAKKAREGKLQPHEYQGGTFSVSNLGMYGVSEFTAIINPPQAAIIAVGGVRSTPCVTSDDGVGVATTMSVTLSHDCRVIDNELAAKWLTVFRNLLESPSILNFKV